ncbi:winged helix-turn-helix transcriptional regulator [Loigolactobacillus iwatensis]|uniref:winged helix-turn-helix transcriptional regulator n=1 Tax=Loigolactobacillus iwatensis TaxID=1267156 RepID=UPI000F7E76B7|nr:helix-turn-helix domain-containing protein [Loigolactobacillus iwatensis]
MKQQIYDCAPGCPVASTLQFIAGKWKGVILYHLIYQDSTHFGELLRAIPSIGRRMLALQLKELQKDRLINRIVIQETPLLIFSRLICCKRV